MTTVRSFTSLVVALALTFVIAAAGCDPSTDEGGGERPPDKETGTPCKSSSDCPSGFCIPLAGEPLGGRAVCTRPCKETNECVPGWQCAPVPGAENLCQCQASTEICDGKDNDCNGVVDDEPSAADACRFNQEGPGAWRCERGQCTCDLPLAKCPFGPTHVCADLSSDRNHCGLCETACPEGAECTNGVCACSNPALVACARDCADIKTDARHCGGCGLACAPGLGCIEGACKCPLGVHEDCPQAKLCGSDGRCRKDEVLQNDGEFVGVIALGNAHVFYGSRPGVGGYVDRSIRRIAKSGGVPETLVTLTEQEVPSLASDGTDLFYGTRKLDLTQDVIVRCPGGTCGSSAIELAAGTTATAMTVKDGFVYWLDGSTGEPKRCAVTGCNGTPTVLAAAPSSTARATSGIWEGFIAVDATHAFVGYVGSVAGSGVVAKVPVGGGALEILTQAGRLGGLVENGARVWFLDSSSLLFVLKTGSPIPSVSTSAGAAIALVANDTNLYWAVPPYAAFKFPLSGPSKPATPIATNLRNPRALAVDAEYLYAGGHTLSRFAN